MGIQGPTPQRPTKPTGGPQNIFQKAIGGLKAGASKALGSLTKLSESVKRDSKVDSGGGGRGRSLSGALGNRASQLLSGVKAAFASVVNQNKAAKVLGADVGKGGGVSLRETAEKFVGNQELKDRLIEQLSAKGSEGEVDADELLGSETFQKLGGDIVALKEKGTDFAEETFAKIADEVIANRAEVIEVDVPEEGTYEVKGEDARVDQKGEGGLTLGELLRAAKEGPKAESLSREAIKEKVLEGGAPLTLEEAKGINFAELEKSEFQIVEEGAEKGKVTYGLIEELKGEVGGGTNVRLRQLEYALVEAHALNEADYKISDSEINGRILGSWREPKAKS